MFFIDSVEKIDRIDKMYPSQIFGMLYAKEKM